MKKYLAGLVAGVLLSTAIVSAQTAETAKVTLTVTNFRPLFSQAENRYVDATVSMAPHGSVSLADRNGMPTFTCKGAVDLEIAVASADGIESCRPMAITFQQIGNVAAADKDVAGEQNFARLASTNGKLLFRNKALKRGEVGRYEFFVLIQRVSDGAIGIIDPDIETNVEE